MNRGAVLITGAAKRVGRALAETFCEEGFDLALHFHQSTEEVKELEKKLSAKTNVKTYSCDLADHGQVVGLLPRVKKDFPELTVLINNASVFEGSKLEKTPFDLYERQMNVNFRAPFLLMQAFQKEFGKGNIINFLDTRISKHPTDHAAYTLSKKALFECTKIAAREFAPNIRVNGIAPGLLLPPEGRTDQNMKELIAKTPLKRQPKMEDILSAVFFILQNESITGQVFYINGGEHL